MYTIQLCQDSEVGTVTRVRAGRTPNHCQIPGQRQAIYFFSIFSIMSVGPT